MNSGDPKPELPCAPDPCLNIDYDDLVNYLCHSGYSNSVKFESSFASPVQRDPGELSWSNYESGLDCKLDEADVNLAHDIYVLLVKWDPGVDWQRHLQPVLELLGNLANNYTFFLSSKISSNAKLSPVCMIFIYHLKSRTWRR